MSKSRGYCPTCNSVIAMCNTDECKVCGETQFFEIIPRPGKTCDRCGGDGIFPKESKGVLPSYCTLCGGSGQLQNCGDWYDKRIKEVTEKGVFGYWDARETTPEGNRRVVRKPSGRCVIEPVPEPSNSGSELVGTILGIIVISLLLMAALKFSR